MLAAMQARTIDDNDCTGENELASEAFRFAKAHRYENGHATIRRGEDWLDHFFDIKLLFFLLRRHRVAQFKHARVFMSRR